MIFCLLQDNPERWIPGLSLLWMGIQLAGYLVVNLSDFSGIWLRIQVISCSQDPFHSQNMKFALNRMFHKKGDRAIWRKLHDPILLYLIYEVFSGSPKQRVS